MSLFTTKCIFCGQKVWKTKETCTKCGREMLASQEPRCFTLAALIETPRARTRRISASMFWTLEEAQAALGRNEDEIKHLSRAGQLREFRDGVRVLYKAGV